MASNKCSTSERLFNAASEVFAEKGYHETTVADICNAAKVNVASVNYHFGSKDALYLKVWEDAFHRCVEAFPILGDSSPTDPPEIQLRAAIQSLLSKVLDNGRLRHYGQLLMNEMIRPTEALRDEIWIRVSELRGSLLNLFQTMLGSDVPGIAVEICLFSVVNQCLAVGFKKQRLLERIMPKGSDTNALINILTQHMTVFALGGIQATKKQYQSATSTL